MLSHDVSTYFSCSCKGNRQADENVSAAERDLKNTLYGVSLRHAGETIGMGRIIGDNGSFHRRRYRGVAGVAGAWAWHAHLAAGRMVNATAGIGLCGFMANGDAKNLYDKSARRNLATEVYMEYIVGPRGTQR